MIFKWLPCVFSYFWFHPVLFCLYIAFFQLQLLLFWLYSKNFVCSVSWAECFQLHGLQVTGQYGLNWK